MKKVILLVLIGLMANSCVSVAYKDYFEDTNVYAELLIDDDDWVVLTVKNNSTSPIQLLADKANYSNAKYYENTILVPLQENTSPGLKVVPILIEPGRRMIQRFVAPTYIEYKRGKVDNINNWTPRNKRTIPTASFSFEYEIDGEIKHFIFEQFK